MKFQGVTADRFTPLRLEGTYVSPLGDIPKPGDEKEAIITIDGKEYSAKLTKISPVVDPGGFCSTLNPVWQLTWEFERN